jgi:multidrug efflux pump subunit AcrA (membrane-fusion protein)
VIAVVTDQVLYRDLVVGADGPDVRGFERALLHAGVIRRASRVMDAATIASWNRKFDHTGPPDRIRVASLLAVPTGGHVSAIYADRGDEAKPGSKLLELRSGSDLFTCHGIDPGSDLTLGSLQLQVIGAKVAVADARVKHSSGDSYIDVEVRPARAVDGKTARLGVEHEGSDGPVLTVPLSAIRVSEGGSTSVRVVEGSNHRTIPVDLGVSSQGLVGVNGVGLKIGDQVELFDPAKTSMAKENPALHGAQSDSS